MFKLENVSLLKEKLELEEKVKALEIKVHELTRKNEVMDAALSKAKEQPRMHARNENSKHVNVNQYRYLQNGNRFNEKRNRNQSYGYRYQRKQQQPKAKKKMWTMWIPKGSKPPFGKVVGQPLNPSYARATYTNIVDPMKVGDQIKA